jgi:hypothetical protein
MSIEYGVFSDEGCLERQFYSYEAADKAATGYRDDGPDTYAAEMCPDHEEQPREGCDVCESEDDEPEDEFDDESEE